MKLTSVVIFTVGAVIGSAVTYKLLKTKYEQIAQDEIDSVKEVFSRRGRDVVESKTDEYTELVDKLGYSGVDNNEEKGENDMTDAPYVISPDEFGEMDDYETVSLTYYADKVLTDEMDIPVEDIESMVGYDSLECFGEYEDDSVFVRNERQKTDYEILLDVRKFSDVQSEYPMEG